MKKKLLREFIYGGLSLFQTYKIKDKFVFTIEHKHYKSFGTEKEVDAFFDGVCLGFDLCKQYRD